MFAVLDEKRNIIAFHDEKRVVKKYVESIYAVHKITLSIKKISKRYKHALNADLYLVKYGKTFVQVGFITYIQIAYDTFLDDERNAKDTLLRILELDRLDSKEIKTIKKAVKIMDKLVYKDERYTPSFDELSRLKADYDPYIYNYKLYE